MADKNIIRLVDRPLISDVELTGDMPLIKPGIYDLAFTHIETGMVFGRQPKVTFWFKVMTFGDAFEVQLPRYYNASKLVGKQGKDGKFKIGKKSDLTREFLNIFPDYECKRLDRLPISKLERVIVIGRVETVKRDYKQRSRHKLLHYSKIAELLEVKKIGVHSL